MSWLGRADTTAPVVLDQDLVDQFAALNATITVDPAAIVPPQSDVFEIMPKNLISIRAFLDCRTQWQVVASMAGLFWLGLDYAGVDVVLRRLQAPDAVFADLQVMEEAALAVLNEARS